MQIIDHRFKSMICMIKVDLNLWLNKKYNFVINLIFSMFTTAPLFKQVLHFFNETHSLTKPMHNINSAIATSPNTLWFKVVSGCVLGSCLGLILTSPHKETRHVNMNCETGRTPATLITDATKTSSAECLLVKNVSRDSSLWVY